MPVVLMLVANNSPWQNRLTGFATGDNEPALAGGLVR
jgi:hypothetical protein